MSILKGLGHDAQTVDEIMQNALASVKGTAYGLDDASTVAASAVAAGIKPGKDLERTLKLVADTSAIAGSDMGEMGAIFNKVASAGKMSAEEINQLNERGIPITQLLAETMNVPTEEIKNLVSAGKIGFPELQNAIEKGMGGAAQTMGQTFEGAVSNVQAAFSRLGARIMTPFTSALTPALGIATSIIDDIAAGTTENIQVKANQLGEMLKTACSSLLSGLEPLLNSLLEIVKQLLPELAKILPDLVKMGMEIIKNLVNGIAQALPTLIPVAVEMINTILNGLVGMLPTLVQAAIEIVVALVNGISDSLPTLIPAIVEAVILISQTLIDNIDILLQAAINLFMALVKAIPEIIKVLVPKIPDIITSIVNALVENIPILLAGAIELFMALVQAIPEIVVVLVQNLPQIVTAIIEGLSRLPELIWNIMTECISKFFDWGNQSESAGTEGSQSFLDTVINVIKELPQKVWEWLQNTINNVVNFFSNIINIGITRSGEFVNNVVNVIRNLPGQIYNSISGATSNIISWGSELVSRGREAASNLFNAIVNKVKEIPGQMFSIGSNIVSGIWNGISNSIGWITNKVKEFAGSILNGIKSALGIHSPSKVFEEQVGKNMALGVGEGFKNTMNSVQRQMQNAIPNTNKIVNITPSNIGAVPTSRTVNGKVLSSNISLTASDVGAAASSHGNHVPTIQTASNKIFLRNDNTWQTITPSNIGAAESSHNHSASNITSGTLPISRGGTGATSASTALSNLGMIISSGTWTPTLSARDDTAPTYTLGYRYARYYRINNLVYITFHLKAKITNAGSGYAAIKGLPFTAVDGADGQGFTVRESLGAISSYPASAHLSDSTATINVQSSGGDMALQWKTGDLWIGFSGCYIKS